MYNFSKMEESDAKFEVSILGSYFLYNQLRRFLHAFLVDESSKSFLRLKRKEKLKCLKITP